MADRRVHAYAVTWSDSTSLIGWRRVDDEGHGASLVTSVGLMVRSTDEEITLTTSIGWGGQVVDALTIPRSAIVRMRKLKHYVLVRE